MNELERISGMSDEEALNLRQEMLVSNRDKAGIDLYDAVRDAAGVAEVPMATVLHYCAAGLAIADLTLRAPRVAAATLLARGVMP